ncbi:hypothetical protein M0804_014457 [Polistes exclamans]|nr:hypothetical protein M0804_014458 [Polistes exclamans]KAI4475195.1 hypothetical protein M0804_014457 [Polistes exclamans]
MGSVDFDPKNSVDDLVLLLLILLLPKWTV